MTAGRLVIMRAGPAVGAVMDLELRLLKFLIVVDEVVVGDELIVDSTSASRKIVPPVLDIQYAEFKQSTVCILYEWKETRGGSAEL